LWSIGVGLLIFVKSFNLHPDFHERRAPACVAAALCTHLAIAAAPSMLAPLAPMLSEPLNRTTTSATIYRWGELDRCKSLKGYERVRRVMPNRCKYNCIKDQYNWEK
jgi:hypothetical protein